MNEDYQNDLNVRNASALLRQQGRIKRLDAANAALARAVLDARDERDAALGIERVALAVPDQLAAFCLVCLLAIWEIEDTDLDRYVRLRVAGAEFGRVVRPSIVAGESGTGYVSPESVTTARTAIRAMISAGLTTDREVAEQAVVDLTALLETELP